MNAPTKTDKTSIVLLAAAALYGLATILLLYSGFLAFPPRLETTGDIKYAVGFFYAPLLAVALAGCALVFRLRGGSRTIARLSAQLGLLLTGGLLIWWLMFESGFLPAIVLPAFFLLVVVNDLKEGRQTST